MGQFFISLCVESLCTTVIVAALVALMGYVTGRPNLADWGGGTPMAISTAVCFLLLAFGILLVHLRQQKG